jgi:hypothetical protein
LAQKDQVKLQVTIPSPQRPGVNDDVTEALRATGLISDSPPQSPCAIQSTSLGCQSTGLNPAADKISAVEQATFDSVVPSRLVIGTSGPLDTVPVMPQVDQLEPDNVLELATQSSEDLVADFDADCGELELPDQLHGCIPSRLNGVASSSQLPESASRTMKVVLTTGKKLSLSESPGDGERILQGAETRTGTVTLSNLVLWTMSLF